MSLTPTIEPWEALRWLADVGVDDSVLESPVDRYQAVEPVRAPMPVDAPVRAERPMRAARETTVLDRTAPREIDAALRPAADLDRSADLASAREMAARANNLSELRAALEAFEGCPLKKTAKNLVFADGNPAADLMFVGEAPGRDEDEKGLPFVGVSGQLLDRFLKALGRDRTNVYIVNTLPWRPPDNREPALAEASVCLPFLKRHIELVKPKVVVALGATATKNLFETSEGITRLRGKWQELTVGAHTCPATATFHPAALLRVPLNKRYVWRDLLSVMERLEGLG